MGDNHYKWLFFALMIAVNVAVFLIPEHTSLYKMGYREALADITKAIDSSKAMRTLEANGQSHMGGVTADGIDVDSLKAIRELIGPDYFISP